jgi:carboxymethylenebutenolidase
MSLELALQRKLAAVCTFYGGGMQQLFERLGALACPVLGLFGDKDVSIPAGTVEEFGRILDRIGVEHEIVTYPDSGHAFFRDSDPSVFKPEASKDAWDRATRFFAAHLTKH